MDASFRCGSSGSIATTYEGGQIGCVGSILHFLHLHHRFHHQRKRFGMTASRQRQSKQDVAGTKYSKLERSPSEAESDEFLTTSATKDQTKEDFNPRATDTTAPPSKEKGRKKKTKGSLSPRQLTRTLSIHYLECDDYVQKGDSSIRENAGIGFQASPGISEGKEEAGDAMLVPEQNFRADSSECLAVNQSPGLELSVPSSNTSFNAFQDPTSVSRHHVEDLQECIQERDDKYHKTAQYHFKSIKNRIKDIIKEEKKEGHRISMDSVLHKVPYGQKPLSDLDGDGSVIDKNGTKNTFWRDSAAFAGNRSKIPTHFRRSHSLSDSLERYSYLLDSINKESEGTSERFKPSHGDTALLVMNRSKTLGRIYYLGESEPNFSRKDDASVLVHDLSLSGRNTNSDSQKTTTVSDFNVSGEQLSSDAQMSYDTCISLVNETSQKVTENSDCPSEVQVQLAQDTASNNHDNWDEPGRLLSETGKHCLYNYERVAETENDNNQPVKASPISVLDIYSEEDSVGPVKFSTSEVRKSMQADYPTIAEISDDDETCSVSSTELQFVSPKFHHITVERKNEAEFKYVFNMLKKSGFSDKEFFGKLYSPEQPINPSLYVDEIMNPESDASESDADADLYHLLLFDLMNEILLEISMESSSYDPWMPCISSHIRSIPFEYNLLPKMWQRISWHLNCQQRQNTKLHPISWKEWINLKYDLEKIAMELDKEILDDLLDEIIFGDLLEEAIL